VGDLNPIARAMPGPLEDLKMGANENGLGGFCVGNVNVVLFAIRRVVVIACRQHQ